MTKRLTPARLSSSSVQLNAWLASNLSPQRSSESVGLRTRLCEFFFAGQRQPCEELDGTSASGVSPVADFESFARDCLECDSNEGHPWRYFNPQSGRFETLEEMLTHLNDLQPTNAFLQQLLAPPRTAMKFLSLLQAMRPMRLRRPRMSVLQSSKRYRLGYIERFSSESQRVVELSRDARIRLASGMANSHVAQELSPMTFTRRTTPSHRMRKV